MNRTDLPFAALRIEAKGGRKGEDIMTIAIIAAMEEEAAALKGRLEGIHTIAEAGGVFHKGKLGGKDVVLLECGIGKANSALTTALLIDKFKPELIIHYGAAGGLDPELQIGDIVVATELAYSDVDATAFGYAYGQVPQRPARYAARPELLNFARRTLEGRSFGGRLVYGLITTEDSFIHRPERAARIRELFPETRATDMEGASIAQAAHQFGVPLLVVRALSDIAGREAAGSFKSYVDLAASNSGNVAELLAASYQENVLA